MNVAFKYTQVSPKTERTKMMFSILDQLNLNFRMRVTNEVVVGEIVSLSSSHPGQRVVLSRLHSCVPRDAR